MSSRQASNIAVRVAAGGPTAAIARTPPNGWNAPSIRCPMPSQAFRVLADPTTTTTEQRVLAVDRGDQLRDAIEAGVEADVPYTDT